MFTLKEDNIFKKNLDNPKTKFGIFLLSFSWFFIILSIILFTIITLPNLTAETKKIILITEYIITVVFIIEYVIRIICAENKIKFIFSFYGLIDLIAILPILLGMFNLNFVRIFRLLMLMKIMKIVRYSKSLNIFFKAIISVKEQLIMFTFLSLFVIYLSATGIYFFERQAQPEVFASILHSMWWAVATLTTVGYGDIYPITFGGKLFTSLILIVGIGVISVPTAIIASALTKQVDD